MFGSTANPTFEPGEHVGIMVMRLYEHLGSDLAHGKGRLLVRSLKWLTSFWQTHYKPSSNLTVAKCQGLPTSCSEVVQLESKMNNFNTAHSYSTTCFQSTNMTCRKFKTVHSWSHRLDFLHFVKYSDLSREKMLGKVWKEATGVQKTDLQGLMGSFCVSIWFKTFLHQTLIIKNCNIWI